MQYQGKDITPFESKEPVAFNPPKKMLCWDASDEKDTDAEPVIREVYYYNPNLKAGRVFSNGDGFAQEFGVVNDYCSEIPNAPKICTNKQLSEWLARGKGEVKFSHRKYDKHIVGTHWHYEDGDENKVVPCRMDATTSYIRCVGIRKWGSDKWVLPTIDAVTKQDTPAIPIERKFVCFINKDEKQYFVECNTFTEAKNLYDLITAYHYSGCVDALSHGKQLSVKESYDLFGFNVYGLLDGWNKPVGEAPYIVFKASANGQVEPGLYSTGPYNLEEANKIIKKAAIALETIPDIESIYISNNTIGTRFKNIPQLESMFGLYIRELLNPEQEWYIAIQHKDGMVYYTKLPEKANTIKIIEDVHNWLNVHHIKEITSVGLRTIADYNGYMVDKDWIKKTFGESLCQILFSENTNIFEPKESVEYAVWNDAKEQYLAMNPCTDKEPQYWFNDIKDAQQLKNDKSSIHKHLRIIKRTTTISYSDAVDDDQMKALKDAIVDGACEAVKCPKELLTEEPKDMDPERAKAYTRMVNNLTGNLVNSPKEETTRMFSVAVRIIPESKRFNKDNKNAQVYDIGRYCSFSEASDDSKKLENVMQSEKYASEKQFILEIYCRETHSDDVLMASSDVFQVISPAFARACVDAGIVK